MAASAERPPAPPAPGPQPEGALIKFDDDRAPYAAIVDQAREQGRETPEGLVLTGLTWQEGDLQYQVTRHVQWAYVDEKVDRYPGTRLGVFGPYGPIKSIDRDQVTTSGHVVKTRNQYGDVVDMKELTDNELQGHLYRAARVDKQGPDKAWLPAFDPEAEARKNEDLVQLPVVVKDDETIMKQIDDWRWTYQLPNWNGLSWNEGDKLHRVVEDEVFMQKTEGGQDRPPKRTWVIETTSVASDGGVTLNRKVLDGTGMAKTMRGVAEKLSSADNASLAGGLRFEVSSSMLPSSGKERPRRGNRHNKAKRAALRQRKLDARPENRELSLEDSGDLVSFRDALSEEWYEQAKEGLDKDPGHRADAEKVQDMVARVGKRRVGELTQQLRSDYLIDARRLDLLKTDPTAYSMSWALLELSRLYHYVQLKKEDPDAAVPADVAGNIGAVNPFARNDQARDKLREIVDRRIGHEYANRSLRLVQQPVARGIKKEGEDDVKQIKDLEEKYQRDTDFINNLQDFVREDVEDGVLMPVERGEIKDLDWPKWIVMGRLLRMSVGH